MHPLKQPTTNNIVMVPGDNLTKLMLRQITKELQLSIAELASGEDAVNYCSTNNPALILMDVLLPGMTGIEAARFIKEQKKEIKVMLMSEALGLDFLLDAVKSEAAFYLEKNCGRESMKQAIVAAIDK